MPSGAPIRIRVGASLDASVERVFQSVEKRAQKAQQKLARDTQSSSREAARAAEQGARAQESAQQRVARTGKKAADDWARSLIQIGKIAEREINRQARSIDRANRRAGLAFAERTSHRATRFLTPNAPLGSMAGRAAREIARGVGVDFSVSGTVERTKNLQAAAIGLAQQERIATGGRTQGPAAYEKMAREQATKLGQDPEQVIALMRAFSGKTGEFGKLNELVAKFGPLAVASGTGFEDMGDAAGFFYNQVKDMPDAMKLTEEGMRAIIGQTAIGSVEMPDFASQMGRIAANANKFGGSKAKNIQSMSALAQLALESGGASSAADAARSVAGFAQTFSKPARLAEFKKQGIDVFTDKSHTKLRDPIELIKDAFRKTKGDIPKLASLFKDVIGQKPVTALGQAYTGAGGGEKGITAIDAAFDRYRKAMITGEAEQQNMNDWLESTGGKAQRFQNQLDEIAEKATSKLIPALEDAGPGLLKFAELVGKLSTWVVENPKMAIAGAISASIMRAGLESTLRSGIERLILGAGGERAAGTGKLASTLGAAGTIGAIAATTLTVGMMTVDYLFNKSQEEQRKSVADDLTTFNKLTGGTNKLASGDVAGAGKDLEQVVAEREAQIKKIEGNQENFWRGLGDALLVWGSDKEATKTRDQSEKRVLEQQKAELAQARQLLASIQSQLAGGININKMPAEAGGRVSQ